MSTWRSSIATSSPCSAWRRRSSRPATSSRPQRRGRPHLVQRDQRRPTSTCSPGRGGRLAQPRRGSRPAVPRHDRSDDLPRVVRRGAVVGRAPRQKLPGTRRPARLPARPSLGPDYLTPVREIVNSDVRKRIAFSKVTPASTRLMQVVADRNSKLLELAAGAIEAPASHADGAGVWQVVAPLRSPARPRAAPPRGRLVGGRRGRRACATPWNVSSGPWHGSTARSRSSSSRPASWVCAAPPGDRSGSSAGSERSSGF